MPQLARPSSPASRTPLALWSWNFVPAFFPHSGKSAPPTSWTSAPSRTCEERLEKTTLVKHGLIPNAVRSTLASAKSRGGSRSSAGVVPLARRHVLAALSAVGSHAGTFHGGALTSLKLFVVSRLFPCGCAAGQLGRAAT